MVVLARMSKSARAGSAAGISGPSRQLSQLTSMCDIPCVALSRSRCGLCYGSEGASGSRVELSKLGGVSDPRPVACPTFESSSPSRTETLNSQAGNFLGLTYVVKIKPENFFISN